MEGNESREINSFYPYLFITSLGGTKNLILGILLRINIKFAYFFKIWKSFFSSNIWNWMSGDLWHPFPNFKACRIGYLFVFCSLRFGIECLVTVRLKFPLKWYFFLTGMCWCQVLRKCWNLQCFEGTRSQSPGTILDFFPLFPFWLFFFIFF